MVISRKAFSSAEPLDTDTTFKKFVMAGYYKHNKKLILTLNLRMLYNAQRIAN
jgi:hypothetical protein